MDARYFSLKAVDGQPIGGIAAADYDLDAADVVPCPYDDRRKGRPMDRTALRVVTAHWPLTLRAAAALSGPDATVHQAWRTCMGLLHAPLFHVELGPRPVPLEMVGGVKVALGFAQLLTDAMLSEDGAAARPLLALSSPDALFADLDQAGRLLGQQHVCSGTRPMFAAFWTALAGDDGPLPAPWSDLPAFSTRLDWQLSHYGVVAARILAGDAHGREAPWLYARAGGDAALALRLFPAGAAPERLVRHLSD